MIRSAFLRYRLFAIGGIPGVLAVLGLTYASLHGHSAPETAHAAIPSASDEAVTVPTMRPQRVAIQRSCTQPGTLHAFFEARVYARVSGYLRELKVDIGDTVEANQPLAVLDVPELDRKRERLQAELHRAETEQVRARAERDVARSMIESQRAQVALSQAELDRVQGLVRQKGLTDQVRDESQYHLSAAKAALGVAEAKVKAAEADVEVAAARVQSAQKELEEVKTWITYATLRAPFRGVITGRNVDLGDLVKDSEGSARHGGPLFTIAQLDKLRLRVAVPERDVPWATVGKKAEFRASALPAKVFTGSITRLASRLDSGTRTMEVEVDLDSEKILLPGMFGHTTLLLDDRPDGLILPTQAVRFDKDGKASVLVVAADGLVRRVDVGTGQDNGERIEIVQGLTGQEQVISMPTAGLAPGQRVQPAPQQ